MGDAPVYACSGLLIRSPIPLPGAVVAGAEADLDFVVGQPRPIPWERPSAAVVAERIVDGIPWYTITKVGPSFVCRFCGVADIEISADLTSAVCHPAPDADQSLLPILVAGTIAAFVLSEPGGCVLHASAVAVAGAALAFVGTSGQGKTTLAALLCAAGAELVADDLLPVKLGPVSSGRSVVTCQPTAHQLRLRPKAVSLLDRFQPHFPRSVTADDRHAVRPERSRASDLPLAAIAFPFPDHTHTATSVRRVGMGEAAIRLAQSQRIEGWTDPERQLSQFHQVTEIIAHVPVLEVKVPWGPPFADDLAEQVLAACCDCEPGLARALRSPDLIEPASWA